MQTVDTVALIGESELFCHGRQSNQMSKTMKPRTAFKDCLILWERISQPKHFKQKTYNRHKRFAPDPDCNPDFKDKRTSETVLMGLKSVNFKDSRQNARG